MEDHGKTNEIIGKTFLKLLINRKVELWERTLIKSISRSENGLKAGMGNRGTE